MLIYVVFLVFNTSDGEVINIHGENESEEIVDKISQNEHSILMNEHLTLFQYVLQDIEEGTKVILTDRYWQKQYIMRKVIFKSFYGNKV